MIRLKNETRVIYDANVIIYSLFPEKYKIPFFTTSAKKLNNYLLIMNLQLWFLISLYLK